MKTLLIFNDPPYGTERSYNGLRPAKALAGKGAEVTAFLMADAVVCAKAGQKVPQGYYNLELMVKSIARKGDVLYGGRLLGVLPVSRVDGWIAAFDKLRAFGEAVFVPGHGEPGGLTEFEISTYEYLTTLRIHMDEAVEQSTDLQEAIGSLDQSKWQHLADFDALAGRNAHQTFLEREAAAFE